MYICKDTGEEVRTYKDYLKTKHWITLRNRIAKERNYKCEICGRYNKNYFQIHHVKYDRVGDEREFDVQLLCSKCHKNRHTEWSR